MTEQRILRRAITPGSAGLDGNDIATADGSVDWDTLIDRASEHSILPQFSAAMGDELPPAIADRIERRRHEHATRCLRLVDALHEFLEDFETAGIRAIPYKGPVLAEVAHDDLAGRQYVDLDLVVHPEDFERAGDRLRDRDFAEVDRLEGLGEVVFDRDGVTVDLHRRILPRFFPGRLDFDDLWDRRIAVDVGGQAVPALAPADRLAVLAVHGTKHCWYRLAWPLDVATLLEGDHAEWPRVRDRAADLGCLRHVCLASWLARELFEVDLDPAIATAVAADPVVDDLGERVRRRLDGGVVEPPEDGAQFRFQWSALPTHRDRVRYAVRLATIPSADDVESVPLPDGLRPLYRVVRPARLATSYGKGTLRNLR